MLIPTNLLENSTFKYLLPYYKRNFFLYWVLILLIIIAIGSLFFVKTTLSVKSQGIIRPISERAEVKSILSGFIDTIYYTEGSHVTKGDCILSLKKPVIKNKQSLNASEINQCEQFIHDLNLLTSATLNDSLSNNLFSPLYKEQFENFLHKRSNLKTTLDKSANDVQTSRKLLQDKAITSKDFLETENLYEKALSEYNAIVNEPQGNWQQDLNRYKTQLSQYKEEQTELDENVNYYFITAPVSGVVQGINNKYPGGLLQPSESVCTISPDGDIVAECYVSPKDIGLIYQGQMARFQIDAFDYNYFGSATGRVLYIDNDFTPINDNIVFKVHCSFDSSELRLKNGFTGRLHKGLTFQVRFIIGQRTLWQLLWGKMDNWMNPDAPKNN